MKNKVVVITGASSGIGRASAYKFAEKGAKIVVADFDETGGMETVENIKKGNGEAVFVKTDVSKIKDTERVVDFAVKTYGSIDVMFNNAGRSAQSKSLLEYDYELYDEVIKVNQYGVFNGILAAGRKMKEMNINGVIVNTSSAYGVLAARNAFSYNASKAAVIMMTKSAAVELAPFGIRVVGVAPGYVDTPIMDNVKNNNKMESLTSKHMRNEFITPESLADAVYLLCLDEANVINGSTVMLDDGYTQFK